MKDDRYTTIEVIVWRRKEDGRVTDDPDLKFEDEWDEGVAFFLVPIENGED